MLTHRLLTGITAILTAAAPTLVNAQRGAPQNHQHQGEHRAAHYRLFDMGTLGGPRSVFPFRAAIISETGEAVGFSDTAAPVTPANFDFACDYRFVAHAFVWHQGDLHVLPGLSQDGCTLSLQVNERHEIIGISENGIIDPFTGTIQVRGVIWRDGKVDDLGTLGGNGSITTSINRHGQIVGWAENDIIDPVSIFGGTQTRAVLWDGEDRRPLDLGTLGGPDSFANYMNDRGQVVGDSFLDENVSPITGLPTVTQFLWCKGRMKDLGNLGGTFSEALQINNYGQVLGHATLPGDLKIHPTFWEDDRLLDLTVSSHGGSLLTANWLTEDGELVGAADFTSVGGPVFGGAIWKRGHLTNIDTEDADCGVEAWGMNDHGNVVGSATCGDETHAWLWNGGHAIDLNTLVPSDAPLHLVRGLMIGEHGDIVGIGVPVGVSDEDFLISGHAFVLAVVEDEDGDEDYQSASATVPVVPRVARSHSQTFTPPTKEAMMKVHELVAAELRPFSLRTLGLRHLAPR